MRRKKISASAKDSTASTTLQSLVTGCNSSAGRRRCLATGDTVDADSGDTTTGDDAHDLVEIAYLLNGYNW